VLQPVSSTNRMYSGLVSLIHVFVHVLKVFFHHPSPSLYILNDSATSCKKHSVTVKKTMVPSDTKLIGVTETAEFLGSFHLFFVFSLVYYTVRKFIYFYYVKSY
jgi:hypothetical protein